MGAVISAVGTATPASAALTQNSSESLVLSSGALSIGALTPGSAAATVGGGPATGTLASGTFADATGTGTGWNGTIATSLFHYQGVWAQTFGTVTALGSTTSANYTAVGSGYYTVTITSYASPTLNFTYSGLESGTGAAATLTGGNTTSNVGTHGATIVWGPLATTYAANMAYTIKVGNLASTALTLANGSGTIAATGGTTSPNAAFTNTTANIPGGSGVDPTVTVGSATKFVAAAVNFGMGSYLVSPQASIAFDPSVWAQTYVAQVTYTIVSGP